MSNRTAKLLLISGITVLTVSVDQAAKYLIVNHMMISQKISIIPGFFNLTRLHNPGGAFGFLAGHGPGLRMILFVVVSLLAVAFLLYLYHQTPRRHTGFLTALALVFAGAVGNLADRLRTGAVIDFLDFYLYDMHWPAFNVADSAITVGMAIIIFHLVFKKVPV